MLKMKDFLKYSGQDMYVSTQDTCNWKVLAEIVLSKLIYSCTYLGIVMLHTYITM